MAKSTFTSLAADIKGALRLGWSICPSGFIHPIIFSLTSAAQQIISLYLSAYVLDSLNAHRAISMIMPKICIALAVIFALHTYNSMMPERNQLNIHTAMLKFRKRISSKAITMDYAQADSPAVNDIRRKIDNDNQWGSGILGIFNGYSSILAAAVSAVSAAAVCAPMFSAVRSGGAAALGMLTLLAALALLPSLYYAKVTNKRYFKLMDEASSRRSPFMYFAYGKGIGYKESKDVRIFRAENLIKKHIDRDERMFYDGWTKRVIRSEGKGGIVIALGAGGILSVSYLFVVKYSMSGGISVGDILKYATAMNIFANSILRLSNDLSMFINSAKQQQTCTKFLNVPEIMRKGVIPVEKRSDNKYEIEFRNVSFRYPGSSDYALRNVSLKFKVGERLAVVGMNGSGKTTFIKLLCRLYDPTDGVITLNGIDIRRYKYNEYMSLFAVVFQDFRLFSFGIGDNIAAGGDYVPERIIECMNRTGLGERLNTLPNGIDTCLYKDFDKGGIEISGGEAQKTAIARALYKNSPFIILDEPTAALDPLAEYEIYSRFDDISGGKTTVYISHRLSSCRFCPNIAVFDNGQITERGSHDELLAANGKYAELWNAQAQYYN